MHRFYTDRAAGEVVAITDAAQLHHLKNVLRLKPGDPVAVFDGERNEYAGVIDRIEKKQALIKVTAAPPASTREPKLTMACAIPKSDRMDDIIDQLTQLGVTRIIPMLTERVVVKLDEARREARLKRWRAIARNAAEQSQRNNLPQVDPITDIKDVIARSGNFDLKLIPHLSGARKLIREVLSGGRPENAIVMIGPEGDFTPGEVELALKAGFVPVSLGATVLRVATAAVAVASYIMFSLSE